MFVISSPLSLLFETSESPLSASWPPAPSALTWTVAGACRPPPAQRICSQAPRPWEASHTRAPPARDPGKPRVSRGPAGPDPLGSAAKPQTPVPCSSPPQPGPFSPARQCPQTRPCPPPESPPHSHLSPPASLGSDVTFLASPSLKPSRPLTLPGSREESPSVHCPSGRVSSPEAPLF